MHPEATVRPWTTCQVVGDALSFAAALGYMYVHCLPFTKRSQMLMFNRFALTSQKSQIYRSGYAFRRGSLLILMFQQEMASLLL